MNSINCHFDTESIFNNEISNTNSNLDWPAFHSLSSPVERNSCSPIWLSVQEDAVAPNDQLSLESTPIQNESFFFRNESNVFNEFHQQNQVQTSEQSSDDVIDSVPKQLIDVKHRFDSPQVSSIRFSCHVFLEQVNMPSI